MNRFHHIWGLLWAGWFFLLSTGLQAQWTQTGADINGEANDNFSGFSVSLSADGSTLAIGAPNNAGGGIDRGQVRVFKKMGSTWSQLGADIDGKTNGELSGWSVSLSAEGTTIAIGSPGNNAYGNHHGQVRVFKYIGSTWIQQGMDIIGKTSPEYSGWSVSLSAEGTILALGAPVNPGGGSNRGQARVYKFIGGSWIQQGGDISGETDFDLSGRAVSLSADGNTLAIGAHANGDNDQGQVRVFKKMGGSWIQLGADIDGEADFDLSGSSVSLSADGSTLAIGAPDNAGGGSFRGHVRVFKYTSGSWSQLGADIDGEANDNFSGHAVSLSADGTIVAIGAPHNAGGGSNRGHVRVFKYISGSWSQLGTAIDGEANFDQSGYSVSLSADGTIVAIGAPHNAGGGDRRGQTRVYSYCSYTQKFLNAALALAKQKGKKIYVCHQGIYNLPVGEYELYFHLFHGDKLGECEVNYCEGLELRGDDLDQFIGTEADPSAAENMILYPNPAGQILNVKWLSPMEGTVKIQVFNSLGQSMIDQIHYYHSKDHSGIPVNIQALPRGLYFLKASGDGVEASRSFTRF